MENNKNGVMNSEHEKLEQNIRKIEEQIKELENNYKWILGICAMFAFSMGAIIIQVLKMCQ